VRDTSPAPGRTFPELTSTNGRSVTRHDFRKALSNAIRTRLYPNTGVTRRHLADALGKDEDTIDNYLNEYSQPDGYVMGLMIQFFDAGFANEVYGLHGVVVAKMSDARKAAAIQAVNKLSPALDALAEMVAA